MHDLVIDNTIPGWLTQPDMVVFASVAALLNEKTSPKILEIGSWLGRSLWTFSENCPSGTITSVDIQKTHSIEKLVKRDQGFPGYYSMSGDAHLWDAYTPGITSALRKIILQKQWATGISNINFCTDGSDLFFSQNLDSYDLIYIDGDHAEDQVFRDLHNGFAALDSTGILIADDYSNYWPSVKNAVDNFCKYYPEVLIHKSKNLPGKCILYKEDNLQTAALLGRIDNPSDYAQLPWCVEPFINLSHTADGTYQVCCISRGNSDPDINTAKMTPIEFFNSQYTKNIRTDMLTGQLSDSTRQACISCIANERTMSSSRRLVQNRKHLKTEKFKTTIAKFANDFSRDADISDLQHVNFKVLGNFCNLKCIMCSPASSSKIAAEYKANNIGEPISGEPISSVVLTPYTPETKKAYFDDVIEIASHLDRFVLVGGESMLSPDFKNLYSLLANSARSSNLNLIIVSNGTVLPDLVIELANRFKSVAIIFSLDGIGAKGSYIRSGLDWELFNKNVRKALSSPELYVSFTVAIQILNIGYLDEVYDYAKALDINLNSISWGNMVTFPKGFRASNLPAEVKEFYLTKYKKHEIFKFDNPDVQRVMAVLRAETDSSNSFIDGIQTLASKDKIRKTSLIEHFPEFSKYYNEITQIRHEDSVIF